jgi:methionine synthase I (cobalamin-dependent)
MPDIALRFDKDMITVEGDMRTPLERQGFLDEPCLPYLNVLEPEAIIDVHRCYHLAGARAAITNTYGACAAQLSIHGLEDRMVELNRAGVMLARSVQPEHLFAAVGPCGITVVPPAEPDADLSPSYKNAFEQYVGQISALADETPDAILLDTFASLPDLLCAIDAARNVCDLPLIASAAFDPNGSLAQSGEDIETVAAVLADSVDVFGLNCLVGPEDMLDLARRARQASTLPLMVRPDVSSSYRQPQHDRSVSIPRRLEDFATDYRQAGVQFIGTCCGSTPAFVGAIAGSIDGYDVVSKL